MEIRNICVVGAGNMGHQIALCGAIAGYRVQCTDVNGETLRAAQRFADTYLPERVAKGKLPAETAQAAGENISFTADLAEAAAGADLVIEAATEKLDLKRDIFAQLDPGTHRRWVMPGPRHPGHQQFVHRQLPVKGRHPTPRQGMQHALL